MSMQVKGKVVQVLPISSGTSKKGNWMKQDFVIEVPGQYPKKVCVSLWGEEKINKYDVEKGLELTAHVELESREYSGKWYTEVRAWKLEWSREARKWQPGESAGQVSSSTSVEPSFGGDGPKDDTDDLPF